MRVFTALQKDNSIEGKGRMKTWLTFALSILRSSILFYCIDLLSFPLWARRIVRWCIMDPVRGLTLTLAAELHRLLLSDCGQLKNRPFTLVFSFDFELDFRIVEILEISECLEQTFERGPVCPLARKSPSNRFFRLKYSSFFSDNRWDYWNGIKLLRNFQLEIGKDWRFLEQ